MDECPICLDQLEGNLTTTGCCKKTMHLECFVSCMKRKLDCPMCRSRHESLSMVQDIESHILVPVSFETRNGKFFRDFFVAAISLSVLTITISYNYF